MKIDHVDTLLRHLHQIRESAGQALVLVLVVPESASVPEVSARSSLLASLPVLLPLCEAAFVVIERVDSQPEQTCNVLQSAEQTTGPPFFDSLHEALGQARKFSPQDVLSIEQEVRKRRLRQQPHI